MAGPPPGPARSLIDGLSAVPRGMLFLLSTRGTKRLLVPPLVLTCAAFALLFAAAWAGFERLLEATKLGSAAPLDIETDWLREALEWLIRQSVVVWTAQVGLFLGVFVVSSFVAMWTFSIVYEALAGPFLDEVQGRLETRWIGTNPRDDLERPTDLSARTCAWLTTAAGALTAVALALAFAADPPARWILLAASPLPFAAAAAAVRGYGTWLAWVARVEGRTLAVSLKASLLAGSLLLVFLPLRLVPFGVGYLLFGAVAGFTTAISLLDIPFSRRGWSLRQRLAFMREHALAMTAFGAVASLVFVIPVAGPVCMVPAASVGGLWLVMRLPKHGLRRSSAAAFEEAPARTA